LALSLVRFIEPVLVVSSTVVQTVVPFFRVLHLYLFQQTIGFQLSFEGAEQAYHKHSRLHNPIPLYSFKAAFIPFWLSLIFYTRPKLV
jgi:hypothetical protein